MAQEFLVLVSALNFSQSFFYVFCLAQNCMFFVCFFLIVFRYYSVKVEHLILRYIIFRMAQLFWLFVLFVCFVV